MFVPISRYDNLFSFISIWGSDSFYRSQDVRRQVETMRKEDEWREKMKQDRMAQHRTRQHRTRQWSSTHHIKTRHITTQHNPVQDSKVLPDSTGQYSEVQDRIGRNRTSKNKICDNPQNSSTKRAGLQYISHDWLSWLPKASSDRAKNFPSPLNSVFPVIRSPSVSFKDPDRTMHSIQSTLNWVAKYEEIEGKEIERGEAIR